jgi:hypothetical protein
LFNDLRFNDDVDEGDDNGQAEDLENRSSQKYWNGSINPGINICGKFLFNLRQY